MKRAKQSVVVFLGLGIFLSLAFASWAQPWGLKAHGGHWGQADMGICPLTPEQAGKLFDLRQKFLDETVGLRKDMVVKRAELRALWRAENPDEKQILAKLKEINAIKAKLQEKPFPFGSKQRKFFPKPRPQGQTEPGG